MTPPMGVTIPSQRMSVSASRWRLPENTIVPTISNTAAVSSRELARAQLIPQRVRPERPERHGEATKDRSDGEDDPCHVETPDVARRRWRDGWQDTAPC